VRFTETPLGGAFVVELDLLRDERGYFARTFDAAEFADAGLDPIVIQCNTSFSARRGTLRGMHYQADPDGEAKLVRCTRGAIFDVAVDLRPDSATFCRWFGTELSADNGRMLYIPVGMAHGFQTLTDDSDVHYQMAHHYVPGQARGVRFDDPAFGIEWPLPDPIVSERDRQFPDFRPPAPGR
jgi:dTDP-4-dehydrorhamnose 3,5-epimerase